MWYLSVWPTIPEIVLVVSTTVRSASARAASTSAAVEVEAVGGGQVVEVGLRSHELETGAGRRSRGGLVGVGVDVRHHFASRQAGGEQPLGKGGLAGVGGTEKHYHTAAAR